MRLRSSVRFALFYVLPLICISVQAQWREVKLPIGWELRHIITLESGRGIALVSLEGGAHRILATRDTWHHVDTFSMPRPEMPFMFEPFGLDVSSSGTIVIVGQHLPPSYTPPSSSQGRSSRNASTAAYQSKDWGVTWTEILPRVPGRYMSVVFRGRPNALLLYEHDWKDSTVLDDRVNGIEYGRDLLLVDEDLQVINRSVVDTLTSKQIKPSYPFGIWCCDGCPKNRSLVDRINDSVYVLETINPCNGQRPFESPRGWYDYGAYWIRVSINSGDSWDSKMGRLFGNEYYSFNGPKYSSMKLLSTSRWVDNQGYVYDLQSGNILDSLCASQIGWRQPHSDARGDTVLSLTGKRGPRNDSIRVVADTMLVSLIDYNKCRILNDDSVVVKCEVPLGYTSFSRSTLKPLLLGNAGVVFAVGRYFDQIGPSDSLVSVWSILVRDNLSTSIAQSSSETNIKIRMIGSSIAIDEPADTSLALEVFGSLGQLLYSTELAPYARRVDLPQLPSGPYFIKVSNAPPIGVMLWWD